MSQKPRAVIVDDSIVSRKVIRKILEGLGFRVVGEAGNGVDAIMKAETLKPDLMVLDIMMPKMDGLSALATIMEKAPTKVILVSAYGNEFFDMAFTGLEKGAFAFVAKAPSGETSAEFERELRDKAKASLHASRASYVMSNVPLKPRKMPRMPSSNLSRHLLIIGASTGGPGVVKDVLTRLRPPFPPVIIVQHLPVGFTRTFAERMNAVSQLEIKEAESGMVLTTNTVFVAPGGKHLVLQDAGASMEIYLYEGDRVNGVMPSLDPTILSATYHYGQNLKVCILSGMGSDGLAGARYLKSNGGEVFAQDEETCVIYGMPKAVIDEGLADVVGTPVRLASALNQRYGG